MSEAVTSETGSKHRVTQEAKETLSMYAGKLQLPEQVVERASLIFKQALEAGLARGRSSKVLMVAAAYAACRLAGTPVSLTDFYELSARPLFFSIGRTYNLLVKRLNMKVPPVDISSQIRKIAGDMGFREEIVGEAVGLLGMTEAKGAGLGKSRSY